MGNSHSSPKPSSNATPVSLPPSCEYKSEESPFKSEEEKQKYVKELTQSFKDQNETLVEIKQKLDKDGDRSDSWFTAMSTLVQSAQAASTCCLQEMEAPIKNVCYTYIVIYYLVFLYKTQKEKTQVLFKKNKDEYSTPFMIH